jgi:hypothetical protein
MVLPNKRPTKAASNYSSLLMILVQFPVLIGQKSLNQCMGDANPKMIMNIVKILPRKTTSTY